MGNNTQAAGGTICPGGCGPALGGGGGVRGGGERGGGGGGGPPRAGGGAAVVGGGGGGGGGRRGGGGGGPRRRAPPAAFMTSCALGPYLCARQRGEGGQHTASQRRLRALRHRLPEHANR